MDRARVMEKRKCGAKTRAGTPCARAAGHGTNHKGYGACSMHLGNTETAQKAAERERAIAEGRRYITEVDVDPLAAMLSAVRLAAGIRAAALQRVGEIDGQENPEALDYAEKTLRQTNRELWQASKATIDAGVAERYVRLAERIGGALSAAIEDGYAVARELLGDALTPEVWTAVQNRILARLESFEGEAEDITDRRGLAA